MIETYTTYNSYKVINVIDTIKYDFVRNIINFKGSIF